MITEETRRQFRAEYAASHRRFQEERDKQYDIYMMTCKRNQTERELELRSLDPRDQGGIALAHAEYDRKTDRASKIYERYEKRAWRSHEARAAGLRAKYGITEVAE